MKTLLKFFLVVLQISIYEGKTNWEDQISFETVEKKEINIQLNVQGAI